MSARVGLPILILGLACGDGRAPHVRITPGPVVRLDEGRPAQLAISVADGDPFADPAGPADFKVTSSVPIERAFELLSVAGRPGAVVIDIVPRCDLVAPLGADVIVVLTVETTAARTANVTLQISDYSKSSCKPRVSVWIGDCTAPPPVPPTGLAIAPARSPGQLCAHVQSADSLNEPLWVRFSTDAPEPLIAPTALPRGDDFVDRVFTSTLGDSRFIRGEFTLSYSVFSAPPAGTNNASLQDTLPVVVGPPSVVVDVMRQTAPVAEFDVVSVPFTVWRRGDKKLASCARVSRGGGDAIDPERPFARLYESATGTVETDGWICGDEFTANVNPPVDARPTEYLRIDAGNCDCNGPPTPPRIVYTTTVAIPVINRAEDVTCAIVGARERTVQTACAVFEGRTVLMVTYSGRRRMPSDPGHDCVYVAESGRFGAELPLARGEQQRVPRAIRSLSVRGSDGRPQHHILGLFGQGQTDRVLALAPLDSSYGWRQAASVQLSIDPAAVEHGVAMGGFGGATHLVYAVDEGGWKLIFDCVRQGCADEEVPGVTGAGRSFSGLGRVDLDADGQDDIAVFFTEPVSANAYLLSATLVRVELGPQGLTTTPSISPDFATTHFVGVPSALQAAATDSFIPGRGQSLMAVRTDPPAISAVRRLQEIVVGEPGIGSLSSPGAAISVLDLDGRSVVALLYGIWEIASAGGRDVQWILQDPVRRELAQAAQVEAESTTYGQALSDCLGSGSIVFRTNEDGVRVTELDVPVRVP